MLDQGQLVITPPSFCDIEPLGRLFSAFRTFYKCAEDADASLDFVRTLVRRGMSRFFVASTDGRHVGFVHLLPYYDTLALTRAWILEDLYVEPAFRKRGVGTALLRRAEQFARDDGAARVSLTTAHTNATAQRVYEANGYVLDEVFRTYHLVLA